MPRLKFLRDTTVLVNEFAVKQQEKEYKLGVKKFLQRLTTSRDGPVKSTNTRQG